MAILYRVFPYLASASKYETGGALYIPPQGGGRLDNPGIYSVLYLSDSPSGAIAEAFGRFPEWSSAILASGSAMPGSFRAIATYLLPEEAKICNLDDASQLIELGLRPSDVVTRDYERSRCWARRIWESSQWTGVRWWSFYDSKWASYGLWNTALLKVQAVRELRLDDEHLIDASRVISRPVRVRSRERL